MLSYYSLLFGVLVLLIQHALGFSTICTSSSLQTSVDGRHICNRISSLYRSGLTDQLATYESHSIPHQQHVGLYSSLQSQEEDDSSSISASSNSNDDDEEEG